MSDEIEALRGDIAAFRDQLRSLTKDVILAADRMHNSPCPAVMDVLHELQDKHVRPMEDREQQRAGAVRLIGLLAVLSTIMVGVLAAVTFFNR